MTRAEITQKQLQGQLEACEARIRRLDIELLRERSIAQGLRQRLLITAGLITGPLHTEITVVLRQEATE
jgi:hypothetical protein